MSSTYLTKVLQSLASWLERASGRMRSLNIGIYGYTQAGKTLFLYNLLRYLEEQNQLAEQNEKCRRFLDVVGQEIKQYGSPRRTSGSWEGVSFVWKFSYSPKETRQYRIEVHDVLGEELDKEASESYPTSGHLARMVRQCDAFLFFFNPTQKEDRYSYEDHLTLELERAGSLLEALLEGRGPVMRSGPGMRPVIFVITANDVWKGDSQLKTVADSFREQIAHLIKAKWPQAPEKLINPTRIVREVANPPAKQQQQIPSAQGRQLTTTVRTLFELNDFVRSLRLKTFQVLVALFLILFFLWFLVLTLAAEDPDIERVLTELQPWADSHKFPTDTKEQSHLGKLLQKGCVLALRPNRRAEQLRQCLNKIGMRLQTETMDLEALSRILGPCRPNPNVEELRVAQRRFWDKLRNSIVADLRNLRDPKRVDSSKDATIKFLEEARDKLERYQVRGKERLANELNHAITFLKQPKKQSYQVVFEPILELKGKYENTKLYGLVFREGEKTKWGLDLDKPGKYQRQSGAAPVRETFQWDEQITISIYAYDDHDQNWHHRNDWALSQWKNKLPPSSLYYIGGPFLGCEGQAIILESEYYKLTLLVKETEFVWVIPDILQ